MDFQEYLNTFETKVIVPGFYKGYWIQEQLVSVRPGKLSIKAFGKKLSGRIQTDELIVVDYYGFQRKSVGFFNRIDSLQRHFVEKQIKTIKSPIVHFGSIKIETLAKITDDLYLLGNFPFFKEILVKLRWEK